MKKIRLVAALLAVILTLTGCNFRTVNEFYSLPKRSEGYTNLQSVIQSIMTGWEYAAPQSGEFQQTLQSADLDGDGNNEYLLFARNNAAEKPLRIFIFSGDDNRYRLRDTIECVGSAFDRVAYAKLQQGSGLQLIVGIQVSENVTKSLSVYQMADGGMERILTTNYYRFMTCDLDENQLSEVFVIHPDVESNGKCIAEIYGSNNGTMERSQEVRLSAPAERIRRIVLGKLNDGTAAVYVASELDANSIITDACALIGGQLTNVSLSAESGTSVQTIRNYFVYADDIDGDGVLELPRLISLAAGADADSEDTQYVIQWYALNSDGTTVEKMYTYHNFVGRWYLQVDPEIAGDLTASQRGNSYEFGLWDAKSERGKKLMTLYILTGQRREEQAVEDNRFVVYKNESTIYAVKLEVASAAYGMTQESLIDSFRMIVDDWNSGMM
ncbi:MAG: hypothetical protein IJO72_04735 [Oscillospiraceae bacterium]|nr:hypothetical protein [Oscillospiraceae bacterium]